MQLTETLNEVCKLSALKATTALSKFIHAPVGVNMKPVQVKHMNDITSFLEANTKIISLFQPIKGDVAGGSFLLYPEPAALNICDTLFNRKLGTTAEFTEKEKSALAEVANIVVGNFLTSLAQSLQLDSLMHQSPVFSSGTYASICEHLLPLLEEKLSQEIVVLISFDFLHITITEYVLVVLEKEKINQILGNLTTIGEY